MNHLLTTLQKANPKRLAKAAAGLADYTIDVRPAYQDEEEVRALVMNGEQKEYTVVLDAHRAFCSCPDSLYRIGKSSIDGNVLHSCYHALAVALFALQHPHGGEEIERCTVCQTALRPDQGLRIEDGNDGRIVESGPFCEPCGLTKLEEAKAALDSAGTTVQSMTSVAA